MKKILWNSFLDAILVSATKIASTKIQAQITLEGTWELVSFNNTMATTANKDIPLGRLPSN